MTSNLGVIGKTAEVSFPELGLERVPAKVDTGADSSAIWASDVRLNESGELEFHLFGNGSEFFTGKLLTAKNYEQVQVKNSSGTSEVRYKIGLLVEFGGRRIRGRFTLTDRSLMTYPVLIGRRTLLKKFLVDVSQKRPDHAND